MVEAPGEARPGKGGHRDSTVTAEDLQEKLLDLERDIHKMDTRLSKELAGVRTSVEVLSARLDTHLKYLNDTLDCQSVSLRRCHEELFGADGNTGVRSRLTRLEERMKQIWWMWASVLGAVLAAFGYGLVGRFLDRVA